MGPVIKASGNKNIKSGETPDNEKVFKLPKKILLIPAAVILVIATGATARKEKCLKIVSHAKIVPAIGALNPAAIAPATPQPMNTSVPIISFSPA